MNISVVKTLTPKKAGTENSEMLKIKTSTNELTKAGLINGRVILETTLLNFAITKPVSSSCELMLDNALPIISIDNGVNTVIKTNITPTYEEMKFVLLKKR